MHRGFSLLVLLVILGLAGVAGHFFVTKYERIPSAETESAVDRATDGVYVDDDGRTLLHIFLNAYYLEKGAYPETLEGLRELTNISPTFSIPKDINGTEFQYYTTEGGRRYELCQKTSNGICPAVTIAADITGVIEKLNVGPGFYAVDGVTNAEAVCLVIDQGPSTPKWDGKASHAWSGCVGYSLARDENGMWPWSAPTYENGVAKLADGQYTLGVYEQESLSDSPRLLKSYTFDIEQ
jgi:hypothetical protein